MNEFSDMLDSIIGQGRFFLIAGFLKNGRIAKRNGDMILLEIDEVVGICQYTMHFSNLVLLNDFTAK